MNNKPLCLPNTKSDSNNLYYTDVWAEMLTLTLLKGLLLKLGGKAVSHLPITGASD